VSEDSNVKPSLFIDEMSSFHQARAANTLLSSSTLLRFPDIAFNQEIRAEEPHTNTTFCVPGGTRAGRLF